MCRKLKYREHRAGNKRAASHSRTLAEAGGGEDNKAEEGVHLGHRYPNI